MNAALRDHGVVVQILLQPLPELHRQFVEGEIARQEVVRAHDGGVSPELPPPIQPFSSTATLLTP